jgi:cyanophycin synthetase
MKILETQVYVGPNLYARFPVIRLLVDLGELEDWPTGKLGSKFIEPLLDKLPGLYQHGCSYGEPGGFVRRLIEGEGTWMGHVLEHVAIELQNVAGADVTFGKTRSAGEPGAYNVVYEYVEAEVGLEAGELARRLLLSLVPEELRGDLLEDSFDFEYERDALIRFTQRRAFGPSTASLVRAAEERNIPWIRLNDYSLVQFGHGRLQKRIQATVTSETRHIAVEIASDKEETNHILSKLGLPVPQQRLVRAESEAIRAAERVGYPVVLKPFNANHGRGVSLNLTDGEQVAIAFHHAERHARSVIVESYIEGFDHRMLVVNGELIAVAKRMPAHVVGDGVRTVVDLVAEVNTDPRRGIGHEKVLTRIEFDKMTDRVLAQQGHDRLSVPSEGEIVYLRSTGNLSTGGTAIDVTDVVHPENREMAVRAAKAVGLDVAGIDFLSKDITKSYREVGGAICEVNAAPGFRMHVAPSEGPPRDAAGPVMDMLFPPGTASRIPIAAITGTNGKTTVARMLAHIQKLAGKTVGLTTTDGVYIDGNLTVEGDMTGPLAAGMVLSDPSVDVAVLETARGGLLRAGMAYKTSDVAACLNVSGDHLGLRGIDTVEQLAEVKRIVIETAKNTVVLNADDPLCLQMADYSGAEHICYVTMHSTHPLVKQHIRNNGRAVALEEGVNGFMITLYDGGRHIPLLWTHLIPATLEGRAVHNVQNAMFAAALAYSLGVKLEDISHGLRTFDATFFQAPGRMNIFDEHPFKVILDYGHNPAAVRAMCDVVRQLDVAGRRLCVVAVPGDRRDEDIREVAQIVAGQFDHYICRSDDSLRGRGPTEVPDLLRAFLIEAGVDEACIDVIPSETDAVDAGLRMARPGDLLLVFGDKVRRSWKQIIGFSSETTAGAPAAPARPQDAPVRPNVPDLALAEGQELISDERGVRIAREKEEAD